ncbi:MAG: phosphatase PAP2 family protein [Bacteroidales bacterium]|nr:phosphatase PAP2 family protein [Bacteroidales bacterium]
MSELIKRNIFFLLPLSILLVALIPLMILIPKTDLHIYLNQHHTDFTDIFFKYITVFGSGLSFVFVGMIYLLFSFRRSFVVISSGVLAGLVVQFLKRIVFTGVLRPSVVFEDVTVLHIIDGIKLHTYYSFPSGHSATVFALCFSLAVFAKRKILKLALFCLAGLVAYSRIYLSQHFLIDVYAGSVIGLLSGFFMTDLFSRFKISWFDQSFLYLLNQQKQK